MQNQMIKLVFTVILGFCIFTYLNSLANVAKNTAMDNAITHSLIVLSHRNLYKRIPCVSGSNGQLTSYIHTCIYLYGSSLDVYLMNSLVWKLTYFLSV